MNHFVFSNYINAWSIGKGLRKLGINLEYFSIYPGLSCRSKINPTRGDVLFFTEESSLSRYIDSTDYHFYPQNNFDKNYIDNKFIFADFLVSMGEKPVPFAPTEKSPDYPIYLKARHSWLGEQKLPRGYICYSERDFRQRAAEIELSGLTLDHFFFQKLLQSPIKNNISTSGFYDYRNPRRNMMIVTQKTMGDANKIALGVVVETIKDPEKLLSRTANILFKLKYAGPFELEYFYEEGDDTYYVLEINPRFWLQHGIFINFYNNGLLKRYLDLDGKAEWYEQVPFKKINWINSLFFIEELLSPNLFRGNKINLFIGNILNKCFYPDLYFAVKYNISLKINCLFRKIIATHSN